MEFSFISLTSCPRDPVAGKKRMPPNVHADEGSVTATELSAMYITPSLD